MWAPGERFCPCSGLPRLRYWKPASYWGGTSLNPATGRREDDSVHYQGIISTDGRTNAERQRERILTASELELLGFWTQHQTSHWKWVNKFQFLLKWLWNVPVTCYWNSVKQSYFTVAIIFMNIVFMILIIAKSYLVLKHYGNFWKPLKAIHSNVPPHFCSWRKPYNWMWVLDLSKLYFFTLMTLFPFSQGPNFLFLQRFFQTVLSFPWKVFFTSFAILSSISHS